MTLGAMANIIVNHITSAALQGAVCDQFLDRLRLSTTDLPSCSNSSGAAVCPTLQ